MSSIDEFRTSKAIRHWPLVVLRVYTGVYFLYSGSDKLRSDNFVDGMVSFLNSQLESSFGIYRPFLESVVLPNNSLFAFLVAWGEFAVGIALILGLATRYAAILGAFLVVNFWFAQGRGILDAQNHDVIWLIIFIVLAGLHAGRVMSVDQRLVGRFRFLA